MLVLFGLLIVFLILLFEFRTFSAPQAILYSAALFTSGVFLALMITGTTMMTAVAAVAGMLPAALALGAGSQMLQPLAIAVIGAGGALLTEQETKGSEGLTVSPSHVRLVDEGKFWIRQHPRDP
jgi:multidrug efflux pump subunit AcrB